MALSFWIIYIVGCVLAFMVMLASNQLQFQTIAKENCKGDFYCALLLGLSSFICFLSAIISYDIDKRDLIHFYTKGYWRIWWKNFKEESKKTPSKLESYKKLNDEE